MIGAALLREYRRRTGATQAELAARLEITKATISRLERGRFRPSVPLAFRIQEVTSGEVPASAWAIADKKAGAEDAQG